MRKESTLFEIQTVIQENSKLCVVNNRKKISKEILRQKLSRNTQK